MSEDLRKACEAFLDAKPMSIPITEEPECVDALVTFTKQQQAAVWREAAERVLEFPASTLPLENLILTQISDYCESQARELEAP